MTAQMIASVMLLDTAGPRNVGSRTLTNVPRTGPKRFMKGVSLSWIALGAPPILTTLGEKFLLSRTVHPRRPPQPLQHEQRSRETIGSSINHGRRVEGGQGSAPPSAATR